MKLIDGNSGIVYSDSIRAKINPFGELFTVVGIINPKSFDNSFDQLVSKLFTSLRGVLTTRQSIFKNKIATLASLVRDDF
ncbi:MAG: hypothetical protein ABH867_03625 [Patescibacteria group bacterium]